MKDHVGRDPLSQLAGKGLIPLKCGTCDKLYFVFRRPGDDKPIKACCVCRYHEKPYIETFQTAAFLRVR